MDPLLTQEGLDSSWWCSWAIDSHERTEGLDWDQQGPAFLLGKSIHLLHAFFFSELNIVIPHHSSQRSSFLF